MFIQKVLKETRPFERFSEKVHTIMLKEKFYLKLVTCDCFAYIASMTTRADRKGQYGHTIEMPFSVAVFIYTITCFYFWCEVFFILCRPLIQTVHGYSLWTYNLQIRYLSGLWCFVMLCVLLCFQV